jgi:two-component system, LytTR family, sensor kinase
MNSLNAALLVNLLGFSVGIALYALLAAMVVRHRRSSASTGVNSLLLATAALGFVWNLGELIVSIQRDFGYSRMNPFLIATAYSALGFLPTVVVHSAQNEPGRRRILTFAAYALSIFAAILHFRSAFLGESVPSALAMQTLTVGAITLAAFLLFFNFRETLEKKAIWATALLVFAVSSLHLSVERSESSWLVELVAHQSSLPIALTILYQNFRFAFADLFLKRAISLLLLAGVAFGLYVVVAAPLLRYHEAHDRNDVFAISLTITLWIATALLYPMLHKGAVWFVDRVILQRADYEKLQVLITKEIESYESADQILDAVSGKLADALTAFGADWQEQTNTADGIHIDLVKQTGNETKILVPTAEFPNFEIRLSEFHGGRRLLSDETAMLESVALITARRIDSLRVVHERCEREFKEQEYSKLAAEAQLTALRSQVNPHFLFNALTTIGYLIQSSPEKAVETLLHLTKLLRGVLSSTGEFSTLGEEIELIVNYLDIERARFEERLSVEINVPASLRQIQIPSLILQPLVENAIKHGISENKGGGHLHIAAERQIEVEHNVLRLIVRDSGASKKPRSLAEKTGVGLGNIRDRLESYYGDDAGLDLDFGKDGWTTAEIRIPIGSRERKAA